MNLETAKGLIDHARTATTRDEANVALDLAKSAIRKEKLEALAKLVESQTEELEMLDRVKMAVAYAVTSGQSTPELRRLNDIFNTKPAFDPKAGIRAAVPAFEWSQVHGDEIQNLLTKI